MLAYVSEHLQNSVDLGVQNEGLERLLDICYFKPCCVPLIYRTKYWRNDLKHLYTGRGDEDLRSVLPATPRSILLT